MPTTVHIPGDLLDELDRRAKALGVSRNRLVVRALEQELRGGGGWSPEFFGRLRTVDDDTAAAVDDLVSAVRKARRSKRAPDL